MKAEFTNSAEVATLKIYDYVGKYEEVNTENIQNQLDECNGKTLEIYINSYGGEVFEGFAIYNMLRRYTGYKKVYIDGIAASIASVIAMAGNEVIMNKASMLMIHNASGCAFGTFKEMEQVAEALKKIKALDPGAKIIMCSAMGQQAMVIEAIQAGAKDFIVKPFQAERVLEAVKKVVG